MAATLPRSGCTSKITQRATKQNKKTKLINQVKAISNITYNLPCCISGNVHATMIRRTLNGNGIYGRAVRKKPLLSKRTKLPPFIFPENTWINLKVLWTDRFKMDFFLSQSKSWCLPPKEPYPNNPDWWWEFLDLGLLPLLDQDNATAFKGTMNSKVYRRFLNRTSCHRLRS